MYVTTLSLVMDNNPDWASSYLGTVDSRLLSLISPYVNGEYAKLYGKAYSEKVNNGQLVFRTKILLPKINTVRLINIWTSADAYNEFRAAVNGDEYFAAFILAGLKYEFTTKDIDDAEVCKLVDDITLEPFKLIQHCASHLERVGMVIGDPLRPSIFDRTVTA